MAARAGGEGWRARPRVASNAQAHRTPPQNSAGGAHKAILRRSMLKRFQTIRNGPQNGGEICDLRPEIAPTTAGRRSLTLPPFRLLLVIAGQAGIWL